MKIRSIWDWETTSPFSMEHAKNNDAWKRGFPKSVSEYAMFLRESIMAIFVRFTSMNNSISQG